MSDHGRDGLQTVIENVELMTIYALRLSGARTSGQDATQFDFVVQPQWQRNDEQIDFRFDVRCDPKDADGSAIAIIEYGLVCSYAILDAKPLADVEERDISGFGANVALYAAYPYLREGVQSIADRLGMPDISMGMLRRGHVLPAGMSFGDVSSAAELPHQR